MFIIRKVGYELLHLPKMDPSSFDQLAVPMKARSTLLAKAGTRNVTEQRVCVASTERHAGECHAHHLDVDLARGLLHLIHVAVAHTA